MMPSDTYTEDSAILASPGADMNRAATAILARPHGEYTEHDIREVIVTAYFEICGSVGVDPILAIAQMIHETANLASFWAARPQRNPAGIGVTGQHQLERPADTTGFAFNEQRRRWEVGLSFAAWKAESVPAHVGRLLAFALPKGSESAAQRALIERALRFRPLPNNLRGSAPVLKRLGAKHNPTGQGWASPGADYGAKIAAVARRIVSTSA